MSTLQDVFTEWQHNLAFRNAFANNPEQALKDAGFQLSPDDFAKVTALVNIDKSKNEKLDDRINK